MTERDWYAPTSTLGLYLSGRDIPGRDARGAPVVDDSFLIVLHAGSRPTGFVVPGAPWAEGYEVVVDTALEDQAGVAGRTHRGGVEVGVGARSVQVLRVTG